MLGLLYMILFFSFFKALLASSEDEEVLITLYYGKSNDACDNTGDFHECEDPRKAECCSLPRSLGEHIGSIDAEGLEDFERKVVRFGAEWTGRRWDPCTWVEDSTTRDEYCLDFNTGNVEYTRGGAAWYHEDDDPREVKRSPNEVTNGTSKRSFEFVKGADDTYWGLWVNSPEMWDSLDTPLAEPLPNKTVEANARRISILRQHGAEHFPNLATARETLYKQAGRTPPASRANTGSK